MIVFAKTRYHYDSYTDFWDLVRLAGFDVCYIDEIDVEQPKFYVLTPWNGEVTPHLTNEKAKKRVGKVAWWCLERFDAMGVPIEHPLAEASPLVDAMWVSDRWTSTRDPRLKYVPMGSDSALGNTPLKARYHFTHQSYAWGRRESMYNRLKSMGLQEGPSCWGADRDGVLRTSQIMLNLQQYPDPVTAPLRFAVAAAYHMAVVSETIQDADPVEPFIRCASYDAIPETVQAALADGMRSQAEGLHEKLCVDLPFHECVRAAV